MRENFHEEESFQIGRKEASSIWNKAGGKVAGNVQTGITETRSFQSGNEKEASLFLRWKKGSSSLEERKMEALYLRSQDEDASS